MVKITLALIGSGLLLAALGWCLVLALTWRPAPRVALDFLSPAAAPPLEPGQPLRVLSWNVQYLAGKGYVFFYDLLDGSGPDERPGPAAIEQTLAQVASLIDREQPDLVLLQEVDDGADRTLRRNQVADLQARLARPFPCVAVTDYWRARFVPHPKVWGRVGTQLALLSRSQILSATRHALPPVTSDGLLRRQFNFRRAVLEVRLARRDALPLAVLVTHFSAFAQGDDTLERQVRRVQELLANLDREGLPWILGGDFNLLPPVAEAYARLPPAQQAYFSPRSELQPLWDAYPVFPGPAEVEGPGAAESFTHYPNDPSVSGPDRVIDYVFWSPSLRRRAAAVLQREAPRTSDHFPLRVDFEL